MARKREVGVGLVGLENVKGVREMRIHLGEVCRKALWEGDETTSWLFNGRNVPTRLMPSHAPKISVAYEPLKSIANHGPMAKILWTLRRSVSDGVKC